MADLQRAPDQAEGRGWTGTIVSLVVLALIAGVVLYVSGLDAEGRENLFYEVQHYLPIVMFVTLACLLFTGYPVAFILGGIALLFGLIGYFMDAFKLIEYFNFLPQTTKKSTFLQNVPFCYPRYYQRYRLYIITSPALPA